MNEVERLKEWMSDGGYSIGRMAQELGMSYDGMYQILYRQRVGDGFKFRFIRRFGLDEATQIFDMAHVVEG